MLCQKLSGKHTFSNATIGRTSQRLKKLTLQVKVRKIGLNILKLELENGKKIKNAKTVCKVRVKNGKNAKVELGNKQNKVHKVRVGQNT